MGRPTKTEAIRVGTRASNLALTQTGIVIDALHRAASAHGFDLRTEVVHIRTTGDAVTDRRFEDIGPKGVFAVELQRALFDDQIDVAVHSLKDLPSTEPDRLCIAAVCEREDARDVLVSRNGEPLESLPSGAVIGTSSARRRALVAIHRPDLSTALLRGNVDTRLEKVARGDVDAAILAAAGLNRLGRADAVTQFLDPTDFVPPPGQGVLAVECRTDRDDLAWVRDADHPATRDCMEAERACAQVIEGGCEVPLGVWARYAGAKIVCDGFVASADATPRFVRERAQGAVPAEVGAELAQRLIRAGARGL